MEHFNSVATGPAFPRVQLQTDRQTLLKLVMHFTFGQKGQSPFSDARVFPRHVVSLASFFHSLFPLTRRVPSVKLTRHLNFFQRRTVLLDVPFVHLSVIP